jgi:hypothetical protein
MSVTATTSRRKQTGRRGRVEMGAGLKAILEPFEGLSSLDYDFARYARLDEDWAKVELEQAFWELPEIRRGFAYRTLRAIARAILAGGAWQFSDD